MDINSDWMLPPEVHDFLESSFPKGSRLLEFGSGEGTFRFAKYFEVFSIEHDSLWASKLDSICHLIPIIPNAISSKHNQIGWYDIDMVVDILPQDLDVVVIDGPPGEIGRAGIISIINKLPKNATYIIDDVHRPEELNLLKILHEWHGGECTIHSAKYSTGVERLWSSLIPKVG